MLESYLVATFAGLSVEAAKALINKIQTINPLAITQLVECMNSNDPEKAVAVIRGVTGSVQWDAGTGSIEAKGASVFAAEEVVINHSQGSVDISDSVVSGQVLTTGGSANSGGKTVIGGNTSLKSQGTSIELGAGASIVMTGSANIKQS